MRLSLRNTRDLSTIQAHADRARAIARDLYEVENLTLHRSDGAVVTGQRGMLDNIRNDLLALAHAVENQNTR